jgi:hypothetical protein
MMTRQSRGLISYGRASQILRTENPAGVVTVCENEICLSLVWNEIAFMVVGEEIC